MGNRNRMKLEQQVLSNQTNEPYAPLKDPISQIAKGVGGLLPQSGTTVNPFGVGDASGVTGITPRPGPGGDQGGLGGLASGVLGDTLSGDYLGDPNPFLADIFGRGADDIRNRMVREAQLAGGDPGSRQFQDTFGRTLGNLYSGLYAPAYGQERQNQMQAAFGTPGFQGALAQVPFAPYAAGAGILGNFGQYGTESRSEDVYGPHTPGLDFLNAVSGVVGNVVGLKGLGGGSGYFGFGG